MITVRAISIRSALLACGRWHSHHDPPAGGLFAVGAFVAERLVCAAVVSRPVARRLDTGHVAEVTRLASDGSTRGAASATLRAAAAAAAAAGYTRVVSYTLLGEAGRCYRAARWRPTHVTRAEQWSRRSRARRPAQQPGRKVRWETGAAAAPRSADAERALREHTGRVAIPTRTPKQTEFAL